MSQSLMDALTKFDATNYPALEMIKSLIGLLASSVSSSKISRNTHTLCTAISRALDVCNDTSSLITQSLKEDGWDSFVKYSQQIDPLEDYLLKLAEVLAVNYLERSTAPELNLDTWITDSDEWAKRRKTVDDTYHLLYTDSKFKDAKTKEGLAEDHKALRNHDDDTFLDELIRLFETKVPDSSESKFTKSSWKIVVSLRKDLKTTRDELLAQATKRDEEAITYLTNVALVANGVAEVVTKSTVTDSDPENKKRVNNLRSLKVWEPAQKLLVHVKTATTEDAKKAWDDWIKLLKDLTPEGIDVKPLRNLLSHMRPSYFLQALELIKACRALVDKQATNSSIARDDVQTAVDDVVAALTSVKGAAGMNEDAAQTKLKTAASALQVVLSAKSVELEGKKSIEAAVEAVKITDMKRFNAWEGRKADPKAVQEIELKVNVTGTLTAELAVNVEANATLDVVLWRLSTFEELKKLSPKKATMQKWQFKDDKDVVMSLSQKVEGLTTVKLVIA